MAYFAEYTDTFGGEANYSWVRRCVVEAGNVKEALRKARAELGLTGLKGDIKGYFGDEIWWTPRRCCTVLMVRWSDNPHEVGDQP